MWKLILAAIVALSIWLYFNPSILNGQVENIQNQAVNQFQKEKTINAVNSADNAIKTEHRQVVGRQ